MACTRPLTRATAAPAAAHTSTAVPSPAPSPFTGWCLRQRLLVLWSAELRRQPMRQLCKGNVAVVKGAVVAGCRAYYGYPITPASEIAEYAALLLPEVGGTFLQAESEVSAINMVYGASSAGVRVMSASSGPGLSLMQEGI